MPHQAISFQSFFASLYHKLTLLRIHSKVIIVPSVNKDKHACHRAFSALFALFALACTSKPASQKPKITRKTIADRCEAVWPRPAGNTGVLPGGLTLYGRISARQNRVCPCQLMVCKNENVLHCCGSPFIEPGWPQYKNLHPDRQPHNFTFSSTGQIFVEKYTLSSKASW